MEADSSGATGGAGAGTNNTPGTDWLLVRVHVPELNVQKSLQFPKDQLVWDVKQQCLAALPKVATWYRELKESFNYGLFCPPVNGKAGKFLDEERRLGDYPFNGPVGYLELKYKRRVYKMLKLDEKQLKALHTRANLRRFLEHVQNSQLDKLAKACAKGLDPNFHCSDTGETPLTIASGIKKPSKVLIALVNGGALLDYRTKDGSTAVHRAVEKNSLEAVKTLLELGASPNYKDGKGLTPLYLSVTHKTDPLLCESLLHDHANIGAQDLQGWQEVHQSCRNGLVQHLDHLLFYGADMNARNASGNTPLHVCAVNAQDSCARQLLFRGCDREALNFANQTPYQVAVIAGNMELAEVIKSYKSDEVVPFRGPPRYNPRRRSGVAWGPLCGWAGTPGDRTSMASTLTRIPCELETLLRSQVDGPPSPCSYDRPFSSASSSLSDGSHPSHEDNASIITDKSLGDTSDIISDSSGVGTNSDTTCSITLPGTTVVCLESYESTVQGHLRICQGDIIEVTGASDCGLLEGTTRDGSCGLFPPRCVQEVRLRPGAGAARNATRAATLATHNTHATQSAHSRRDNPAHYSATAPRIKKIYLNGAAECRTVVLHRARRGFGFVLRGAKASSPLMELRPSERCPGLQYLDDVDKGGVADMAGLRKGDFLIAINGEDVSAASHEHVVDLIRSSGSLVSMTVVSVSGQQSPQYSVGMGGAGGVGGGVPTSKSVAQLAAQGAVSSARQYATLPRKAPSGGGRSPAPAPPRRDPRTTLSVGRARAKSMVAGLENGGDRDDSDTSSALGGLICGAPSKASSAESVQALVAGGAGGGAAGTPPAPRTASIRARPASSRITTAQLEELFQRQQDNADKSSSGGGMMTTSAFQEGASSSPPYSPAKLEPPFVPAVPSARVYASVAEMKRSKGKSWSRVRVGGTATGSETLGELRRNFHSTPDLALEPSDAAVPRLKYRSQEDVHVNYGASRLGALPPPSHPPPPPPAGQLVAVEVLEGVPHTPPAPPSAETPDATVMSSFRPSDNAKLYASPQDVNAVAYRCRTTNTPSNKHTVRKTQSLRSSSLPPAPQPLRQCSADDPNNQYAQPFKKPTFSRQSSTPPIPEPDYSMSESEEEGTMDVGAVRRAGEVRLPKVQLQHQHQLPLQPAETSANSNASGSSSGSGSMHHSFSVDEIQKIKTQLKCSKSYPNDFISQDGEGEMELDPRHDDGDNSSSGVSSDQELTIQQEPLEKPHAPQPTRKMTNDVMLASKMEKCTMREPVKTAEPVRSKDKVSFNTNVMVKSSNNVITTEPVQLHSSSESISSSGMISVCSHRTPADIPAPPPARYRHVTTPSGNLNFVNTQLALGTMQRHNSLTRKQAASYLLKREPKPGQSAAERLGVNLSNAPTVKKEQNELGHSCHKSSLMRNAVSLAQLPPPIEEVVLCPDVGTDATAGPDVPPLAPPPQFSDKVRIVAALPKQHSHTRLNH